MRRSCLLPRRLVNVVATADELNAEQRAALAKVQTVLSAGAPIPVPLLEALSALVPNASLHTPYGMTEGLPVTDVSFEMIRQAIAEGTPNAAGEVLDPFARDGVCVGLRCTVRRWLLRRCCRTVRWRMS